MDISFKNVPTQVPHGQMKHYLRDILRELDCFAFELDKFKTFAKLSLPDLHIGRLFLHFYGVPNPNPTKIKPRKPLSIGGQRIYPSEHHTKIDRFVVLCLRDDDAKLHARAIKPKNKSPDTKPFRIDRLDCGTWRHRDKTFTLHSYYRDARQGRLCLGRKSLAIVLSPAGDGFPMRIDIDYRIIESVTMGNYDHPSVTFTLMQAPVFSRIEEQSTIAGMVTTMNAWNGDHIAGMMSSMNLSSSNRPPTIRTKRIRTSSLHEDHSAAAAAHCWVYQVRMSESSQLEQVKRALQAISGGPDCIVWPTSVRVSVRSSQEELRAFDDALLRMPKMPFAIKFQLHRLVSNVYLHPNLVRDLLGPVLNLTQAIGQAAVVSALMSVSRKIPFPGPGVSPSDISASQILRYIKEDALGFKVSGTIWDLEKRHAHLGMVHRIYVTPTEIHLEGPQLETMNRVLRKYPSHTDHFLRVTFVEETDDLLPMQRDPQSEIYGKKFKADINRMIMIGGRGFVFLGFSHSSLRARQCFFMSPFIQDGRLINAQQLIQDLGDFTSIRSPAKCAARIGQAFSDATDTLRIRPDMIQKIPDVERNGRTFTDGVGTVSSALLTEVWHEFGKTRKKKATLLQIRLQGAKGMLSLDPQLVGEVLCLRDSMIKFEGSPDLDLEICGAAYKPLPMYLNRQLICILEALGVELDKLASLQDEAVHVLEKTAQSPVNAARFLEISHITSAQVPALIRHMKDICIDYRSDTFLRQVVELSLLVQLRDIKHRGRIPVANAHTLYGVADETGYLRPDEIFVCVRAADGKKNVLTGRVMVTRSPALHPGDVQFAHAVTVPTNSPLHRLLNCVIFSQHGERDLPSMLSGGDLDGDLYNVIFEESLWPRVPHVPADYARPTALDIGRVVTAHDMQNFFLEFMQSDKLGFIANSHLQCADQKLNGPLSEPCLIMAELHSTAVDFAKTGIPAQISQMPKDYARYCKPDFMANSSRMLIGTDGISFEQMIAQPMPRDLDDDAVVALEPDQRTVRFYRSEKVLGHLSRAIDDQQFLKQVQREYPENPAGRASLSAMETLWDYVQRKTLLIEWKHQIQQARNIRDMYEGCVADTAFRYSSDHQHPLSEVEVVTGVIVGKDGGIPNKRLRESSMDMKEKFGRDTAFVIEMILKGDEDHVDVYEDPAYEGEDMSEGLERSIAAFGIAMQEAGEEIVGMGALQSFKYVAAAVCLRQLDRYLGF